MIDERISTTLSECRKYKDTIMSDIKSLLSENNFDIQTNENDSELHVLSKNLSQINEIIKNNLNVPDCIKNIMIDTYQTQEGIYIRLKFK